MGKLLVCNIVVGAQADKLSLTSTEPILNEITHRTHYALAQQLGLSPAFCWVFLPTCHGWATHVSAPRMLIQNDVALLLLIFGDTTQFPP